MRVPLPRPGIDLPSAPPAPSPRIRPDQRPGLEGTNRAMRRLMVIADDPSAVQAIRPVLRQTVGFDVVGFVDGRQAITRKIHELQPEVVLVDDMRDREHTLSRLAELAEIRPDAMVVLLGNSLDDEWLSRALRGG